MSISNRHQFAPLTKSSKPLSGQRMARVIAKASKDGTYSEFLKESLMISVPFVSVEDVQANMVALMPHVLAMVMDTQDSIISELRKSNGCTEVGDEEISVNACIAFLDASERGNRVTSEFLAEWFKETYSLQAAEFIALSLKWSEDVTSWNEEQLAIIETKSRVLGSMFSGFASGKYSPDIPKCKAMVKFSEFVGESRDERMVRYADKAAKILAEKLAEVSSDALGF